MGLIFGGIVGTFKNRFIWKKYLQKSASEYAAPESLGGLYARSFISYAVNLATLAAAFFSRELVPFDGIAFLVGTAIALAAMNKALSLGQKKQESKRRESGQ